jgi:hypothetical protein
MGLALLCQPLMLLGPSNELACGLFLALFGSLAVLSAVMPERGLPDRLAGTWPVPR